MVSSFQFLCRNVFETRTLMGKMAITYEDGVPPDDYLSKIQNISKLLISLYFSNTNLSE